MLKKSVKITILVILFLIFILPNSALAQEGLNSNIQVTIPGADLKSDLGSVNCEPGKDCEIGWIGQYVGALYRFGVVLAVALSVIMIMIAGFLWLTSSGNSKKEDKGKNLIFGAFLVFLLALFSYIILYTLNPRLIEPADFNFESSDLMSLKTETSLLGRGALGLNDSLYYRPDKPWEYTMAHEGFSARRYEDPPASGRYSIGFGHQIIGNESPAIGSTISEERARELFYADYRRAIDNATSFVGNENWQNLSPDRRTVLIDMAYNLGGGGLSEFGQLRLAVISEDWPGAYSLILTSRYASQVGQRAERNARIILAGTTAVLLRR
ncbi:hypothetical protein HYZ76_01800 [Candidatus Falkowbacteria bacterium]|nr:hypothetical protein [Candidatus Falkowbacteria bacterium]